MRREGILTAVLALGFILIIATSGPVQVQASGSPGVKLANTALAFESLGFKTGQVQYFGGTSGGTQVDMKVGICFTAPSSGAVSELDLYFFRASAALGTMTGQIYSTTGVVGNSPTAGTGCASLSSLLATSSTAIDISTITASTPTLQKLKFSLSSTTVLSQGSEYIAVAHIVFTNSASSSVFFGDNNGVSTAAGMAHVDNFGTATQGNLNQNGNDVDEFTCTGSNSSCESFTVYTSPSVYGAGDGTEVLNNNGQFLASYLPLAGDLQYQTSADGINFNAAVAEGSALSLSSAENVTYALNSATSTISYLLSGPAGSLYYRQGTVSSNGGVAWGGQYNTGLTTTSSAATPVFVSKTAVAESKPTASPSWVQSAGCTINLAGPTCVTTITTSSGHWIVVAATINVFVNGRSVSGVADTGGSTYSKLGSILGPSNGGGQVQEEEWATTAQGSHASTSVTVTFSQGSTSAAVIVSEYSGVNQVATATVQTASGTTANPTLTQTLAESADFQVCAVGSGNILTSIVVTSQTGNLRGTQGGNNQGGPTSIASSDVDNTGSTSSTCSVTFAGTSGSNWAIVGVDIAAAPPTTLAGTITTATGQNQYIIVETVGCGILSCQSGGVIPSVTGVADGGDTFSLIDAGNSNSFFCGSGFYDGEVWAASVTQSATVTVTVTWNQATFSSMYLLLYKTTTGVGAHSKFNGGCGPTYAHAITTTTTNAMILDLNLWDVGNGAIATCAAYTTTYTSSQTGRGCNDYANTREEAAERAVTTATSYTESASNSGGSGFIDMTEILELKSATTVTNFTGTIPLQTGWDQNGKPWIVYSDTETSKTTINFASNSLSGGIGLNTGSLPPDLPFTTCNSHCALLYGNTGSTPGYFGVCFTASTSGTLGEEDFWISNAAVLTGTVQAQLYSTTGTVAGNPPSSGTGCASQGTLLASSTSINMNQITQASAPADVSFPFTSGTISQGQKYMAVVRIDYTNTGPLNPLYFLENAAGSGTASMASVSNCNGSQCADFTTAFIANANDALQSPCNGNDFCAAFTAILSTGTWTKTQLIQDSTGLTVAAAWVQPYNDGTNKLDILYALGDGTSLYERTYTTSSQAVGSQSTTPITLTTSSTEVDLGSSIGQASAVYFVKSGVQNTQSFQVWYRNLGTWTKLVDDGSAVTEPIATVADSQANALDFFIIRADTSGSVGYIGTWQYRIFHTDTLSADPWVIAVPNVNFASTTAWSVTPVAGPISASFTEAVGVVWSDQDPGTNFYSIPVSVTPATSQPPPTNSCTTGCPGGSPSGGTSGGQSPQTIINNIISQAPAAVATTIGTASNFAVGFPLTYLLLVIMALGAIGSHYYKHYRIRDTFLFGIALIAVNWVGNNTNFTFLPHYSIDTPISLPVLGIDPTTLGFLAVTATAVVLFLSGTIALYLKPERPS